MHRAIPLLAAIAISAVLASAVEGAPAPSLTIKAKPNPVRFNKAVTVSGRLSSGKSGVGVVLEASTFPFSGGFKTVGTRTTGSNGSYSFSPKPSLATRYRVSLKSQSSVRSKTITEYVVAGYKPVSCTIEKSNGSKVKCGSSTPLSGHLKMRVSYRYTFPASTFSTESAKPVRVYYGQRNGSSKSPDTLKLVQSVAQQPAGGNQTNVKIKVEFNAPNGAWANWLTSCIKFTEAQDGLGLPGDHHCGRSQVSRKETLTDGFG
jgi:hypothetical protein